MKQPDHVNTFVSNGVINDMACVRGFSIALAHFTKVNAALKLTQVPADEGISIV